MAIIGHGGEGSRGLASFAPCVPGDRYRATLGFVADLPVPDDKRVFLLIRLWA